MGERERKDPEGDVIDLDDVDRFVGGGIEWGHARTADAVTLMFAGGLVGSPLLYFVALLWAPQVIEELKAFMESWFKVMGPLTGTAIGFYFLGKARGIRAGRRRRRSS
jgi:hypothetical protein